MFFSINLMVFKNIVVFVYNSKIFYKSPKEALPITQGNGG